MLELPDGVTVDERQTGEGLFQQAFFRGHVIGVCRIERGSPSGFQGQGNYDYFCDDGIIPGDAEVAVICHVEVTELRGRKIASILICRAIAEARTWHVPAIYLHAADGDYSTKVFWERFGFIRIGSDSSGMPYMRLVLT